MYAIIEIKKYINENSLELSKKNTSKLLSKIDSWDNLTEEKIQSYSNLLKDNNLGINSLQSLFFNVKCDDISNVEVILNHFQRLINYSKILSVKLFPKVIAPALL
jgi:hypothetical protein